MDNKLLVGLSSIGSQQATATELKNEAINQLLYYSDTHPADRIIYRSSDMVRCAHYDAGFHNKSKDRIRAGAHIFLSRNDPIPCCNSTVLILDQIIKFVMSSASEAELGSLFITAQYMVSMRNTLVRNEMSPAKSTHPDIQLSRIGSSQYNYCPREI